MKKYPVGLIIGRFQPFHNGHRHLIQVALDKVDVIIIGIGSSNVKNANNPFSYSKRKQMLHLFIKKEKIGDKVLQIVPLPDVPDDDVWLKRVTSEVKNFDVVIGNNDWTNGIFKNAGYKVLGILHKKRDFWQGKNIRALIQKGGEWQMHVPRYLVKYIKND